MKTYAVKVPITGYVVIEVSAENEAEAIDIAVTSEDVLPHEMESWDAHKSVVQGNIFHGVLNSAEATLVDDGEE